MTLQKSVGIYPAEAVEGDFASTNPRATAVNNNGGFISDGTVVVGGFAWADGRILSNTGTGAPTGFISRTGNFAYITGFESSTLTINKGVETTVHVAGDFYVRVKNTAAIGDIVQVSLADGSIKPLAKPADGTAAEADSGNVLTNFTFKTAAVSGGLAIISTY